MKKFLLLLTGVLCLGFPLLAQDYLAPQPGHKVAYFDPDSITVQTFDLSDRNVWLDDGMAIYKVDPYQVMVTDTFPKPREYSGLIYPSFLNVSPDGNSIWTGYTIFGNTNDRIYKVDVSSGIWTLAAMMPSNFDLEFWNDSLLVSGLNDTDFSTPAGIFVLDTSGRDQHRKIIDIGGYSAGVAVDSVGNLYYATSFPAGNNALYRWDSATVASVLEDPAALPLGLDDAQKLADLPMGAYDCEVDKALNVVFTMNAWAGEELLARWNGNPGEGPNYDTIAVSSLGLGMVKSAGIYTQPYIGNSLFTKAYGMPVADIHTSDYPPVFTSKLPTLSGFEDEEFVLGLEEFAIDLDDRLGLTFQIRGISDSAVANVRVENDSIMGTFKGAGESRLLIRASNNGLYSQTTVTLAGWPKLSGDFLVADFDDQELDEESYWNGSDGSGSFISGPARFNNDYNTEYGSWSGWSYSNTTDVNTAGWFNQYSAITGSGFGLDTVESSYGVSNLYGPSVIDFPDVKRYSPEGFFVTNATYAALSMEEGDWVAKKFGGPKGKDPDYFKLLIWGSDRGEPGDTVEFYLADYRFDESWKDHIVKSWQWVDLSSMGNVDSIGFSLESSDNSQWGMNTPAYFCVDDLYLSPDKPPVVATPLEDFTMSQSRLDTVIDLRGLFMDPDDEDSEIIKSLKEVSDEILLAGIEGDELSLNLNMAVKKSTWLDVRIVVEGNSAGLSVMDTLFVTAEVLTGIEDKRNAAIKLYPNPSTGQFRISAEGGEELNLQVLSMTGRILVEMPVYRSGDLIDMSSYPAGSYLVKVGRKEIFTTRLLILH